MSYEITIKGRVILITIQSRKKTAVIRGAGRKLDQSEKVATNKLYRSQGRLGLSRREAEEICSEVFKLVTVEMRNRGDI